MLSLKLQKLEQKGVARRRRSGRIGKIIAIVNNMKTVVLHIYISNSFGQAIHTGVHVCCKTFSNKGLLKDMIHIGVSLKQKATIILFHLC